jgi:CxxC motif-containing protein (DUF1111 family)
MRRRLALAALALLAATAAVAASLPRAAEAERAPIPRVPRQALPGVGEFGGPSRPLDAAEMGRFLRGRALFDRDFHRVDGLGTPDFNGDSCRACHQDPVMGGAGPLELNVSRFGRDEGGAGPFTNLPGGQVLHKLRPPWADGREEYDPATADVFEQRQTPLLFGAGLIDGIPEAAILANEDPTDADGDGVFGIARRVSVGGMIEVGRFGWKAQIPRLADFSRDGLGVELGITTSDDGRGFAVVTDLDAVPDPELSDEEVDDLTFFIRHLAPPPRRGSADPAVAIGATLFESVGCAKCHRPALPGEGGVPVPLFSDLLLHRVHDPGFRGMEEPGAPAGFYRTPPLWGVSRTAPYLHDGRAETLRDAILGHAGEATGARLAFEALSPGDRDALLAFLEDL